jgi:tyrosine-protein phosphatase SIW14
VWARDFVVCEWPRRFGRLAAQQHLRAALVLPLLLAIKPPPSFARVEQGVYRSGVFGAEHFEFVARLHLKTLLHVSPDYLLRSLVRFSQDNSIRLVNLGAHESWTDVNSPLKSEFVKEALEVVLNPENHPILVSKFARAAPVPACVCACMR